MAVELGPCRLSYILDRSDLLGHGLQRLLAPCVRTSALKITKDCFKIPRILMLTLNVLVSSFLQRNYLQETGIRFTGSVQKVLRDENSFLPIIKLGLVLT